MGDVWVVIYVKYTVVGETRDRWATFQITRHYMRTVIAAYPKKSTLIEPSYRLITGMNLIGCLHRCLFGAHFFNSTRDGSSVPMVRDAWATHLGPLGRDLYQDTDSRDLMSLPIHIPIAYNPWVFRQRFSKYILYPFKLISNCIEKCGSSDPTESGSSVHDTILITLSQSTVESCGRCIKTIYWRQYNLHANNTDTYMIL